MFRLAYCLLMCMISAGKDFSLMASLKIAKRNSGFGRAAELAYKCKTTDVGKLVAMETLQVQRTLSNWELWDLMKKTTCIFGS